MRFQDFDELEFTRYDDEEIMRRYAEELEEREEEDRKRKRDRFQAMLDERRERDEEDDRRRDEEEQGWASDSGDYAVTLPDPAEEERIRKSNQRIFRFFGSAALACLGALLGVVATSAAVYARNR
ncbi:Eukaryotic translation initiation factor 3 110 kDa subunit [Paraburkholderia caribensis]|uniref:hypothetical protein n=1 Tax=Paraburkholderia caribensis TaxID=75105 RepID=UPI001CACF8EB|nr:hypothetical protein [Paraburkholderia caribensis]CAG9239508.1 Eukaryotic translation initiation factor 3 110 kDa subunit [Paraburkholderia caribensis]